MKSWTTFFFCIFLDLRNNSYVPPNERYKNWGSVCYGKKVRQICVNGIGDLNKITKKRALFVNKFHLNYQYLALDCLEEWLYNRTLSYYTLKAVIWTKLHRQHKFSEIKTLCLNRKMFRIETVHIWNMRHAQKDHAISNFQNEYEVSYFYPKQNVRF